MIKFVEVNNNKIPIHSFSEAKVSHNNMKNAALLVPNDVVVVDFDGDNIHKNGQIYDEKIIFYLLTKYRPYWTKSRPNHFQLYFKMPKDLKMKMSADILTLGGFQVDYRVNKNSLAIIKMDWQLRECACELTEEVLANLPVLPTICYPMYSNSKHTSFIGLEDGDGRNELMFHHIIFARKRYPKLDLKEAINYINNQLFKDPLEENILDNMIMRSPMYSNKNNKEIEELTYEYKEIKLIKFSDVKTKEPKWLWYPYIPLGTLVLAVGDPGTGKSYLALYVASKVSNGDKFPFDEDNKNVITEPAKVLFQNGEDGVEFTLSLRLDKLGANKDNIIMIDESENIFRLDQIEILESIIVNNNIKLVVIDPIQQYLPAKTSMNHANEVRNALAPLIKIAEKHECTIIFIIHQNKSDTKNKTYKPLGSVDFVGICRSMLTVEKDKDKNYIYHTKSSLSSLGKTIMYEITDNGLEILGLCDKDEENSISKKKQAMQFLKDNLEEGPLTSVDIIFKAIAQNISMSTLKRAKKELGIYSVQIDKTWYFSFEENIDYAKATKRYVNRK